MNVRDLCNLYESLNGDILELKQTKNRIPTERDYSNALLKGITTEIEKYENLKSMLLDLEVDLPSNMPVEKISNDFSDTSFFVLP
ncbi:MAG: hypothetical protein SFU98_18590 [Leptospiraceae bacterium]|nr:hypothetical protein [Leptospiraceae bacterium]